MPSIVSTIPSSMAKLSGLMMDIYDFKDNFQKKLLNSTFHSDTTLHDFEMIDESIDETFRG